MKPRPNNELAIEATEEDNRLEVTLRPQTLTEYVGQEKIVEYNV